VFVVIQNEKDQEEWWSFKNTIVTGSHSHLGTTDLQGHGISASTKYHVSRFETSQYWYAQDGKIKFLTLVWREKSLRRYLDKRKRKS
jgi:hypothetical protein